MSEQWTPEKHAEALALCEALPAALSTDWEGTNHYEVNVLAPAYELAWIAIADVFYERGDWSSTEQGKRLGRLLDFACAARTLLPEALAEIERLQAELARSNEVISSRMREGGFEGCAVLPIEDYAAMQAQVRALTESVRRLGGPELPHPVRPID